MSLFNLKIFFIFGFGTARLGEWRLNHIYGINGAEVISASCLDSSVAIVMVHALHIQSRVL